MKRLKCFLLGHDDSKVLYRPIIAICPRCGLCVVFPYRGPQDDDTSGAPKK